MTSQHQGPELASRRLRVHRGEAGMTSLGAAIAKAAVWLELDGVEGVAQGESHGEPCILVLASRPAPEVRGRVPASFAGFRVAIRSSLAEPDRRRRGKGTEAPFTGRYWGCIDSAALEPEAKEPHGSGK